MYDWLPEAVADDATVVTANRRLARVLGQAHARQQLDAGKLAWRSPRILAWVDWLDALHGDAQGQEAAPTRINRFQSTHLWDRALRREIGNDAVGIGHLVRLARDTWQRLADWNVGIRDVALHAQNSDHRSFAAAAGRYLGILEHNGWIDDAGLAGHVTELLALGRIRIEGRVTFAGFDRDRPAVRRIRECLVDLGCEVSDAPPGIGRGAAVLCSYENADAELRAAGAWARAQLAAAPAARIAIVVAGLEQDAERAARLVREGLVPGYRLAGGVAAKALNVSYGRRLSNYPAVGVALLWLRWLGHALRSHEVGHLLRSPLLGQAPCAGRARLELRVRGLPDRDWSPAMVTAALQGKEEAADAADWLRRVAALSKARHDVPASAPPATWAVLFDQLLEAAGWPGEEPLDSADFQLVNRWRDLLNDLARMDLVSPRLSLQGALAQLESMAAEAVFQPESDATRVHLLGPLEAAGLQFDAVWLTGLTASRWPPPPNPSVLVARRLQEAHGMPDATPADTLAYARGLLRQLGTAAPEIVCSYASHEDDAEQSPSELLALLNVQEAVAPPDPGWFAATLPGSAVLRAAEDRVPAIVTEERLTGGAGTLQNQLNDPLAAFAGGRLAARPIEEQARGLPPLLRGNLVHDALHRLYLELPSRDDLRGWTDLPERIGRAVEAACARHRRNADAVLLQRLAMEQVRIGGLLGEFLAIDREREAFEVAAVERTLELREARVLLELRIDRIDRLADGHLLVIDYKTGAEKKFLDGQGKPREIQLVAYACALEEAVGALALANIDSRVVGFSGAGAGFTAADEWPAQLESWKYAVRTACAEIAAGDVRINGRQAVADARPLNLLSRFTELRNA